MKALSINTKHIGQTLEIATAVKSKPIRGTITGIGGGGPIRRVELQGAFGRRWHTLTESSDVSLVA